MTVPVSVMAELAGRYLERQGWYLQATQGEEGALELVAVDELSDGQPGLARLTLQRGDRRLQLFVGWRRAAALGGLLRNEEAALLGAAHDEGTPVVLYDALCDDECCRQLLQAATGGAEDALRVRHVATLVSHASLVFDERLFMKVYRVLEAGDRPEAEMLFGLDRVGFNALVAPVARWQAEGCDLALVREFLPSALEGRLLALTSLRDLLAQVNEADEAAPLHPADADLAPELAAARAGGDIAGEIVRLGRTTARLHLALGEAFGREQLGPETFGPSARARPPEEALRAILAAAPPGALGQGIRLHGDYHLRRVMRSDAGWLVTGFGDDPLYATPEPDTSLAARTGSPLEDVADMFFALRQVADEAVRCRPILERPLAEPLALAWTRRNREALLRGYLEVDGVEALLPAPALREELLGALAAYRRRRYEATFEG